VQENRVWRFRLSGYEERDHFRLIEKRSSIRLPREQIEGFELVGTPPPKVKGPDPVKGKGKSKKEKARELAAKNGGNS
jgi:ATP-dependent RNA helicase RhlE